MKAEQELCICPRRQLIRATIHQLKFKGKQTTKKSSVITHRN